MESARRLWLIDAAYLLNAQRSLGTEFEFDYKKLRDKVESKGGEVFQAYYVNSTPNPPSDSQDKFHTWLKTAPPSGPKLQVKLYKLKELHVECPSCRNRFDRTVQKGVDVGISTLALTLVSRYDTLVLSSGDGDYKDMLEHIRNTMNKRLELVVFNHGVSTDLQSLSDEIHWINDFAGEIRKVRPNSPNR